MRGEMEDIPPVARLPRGVIFSVSDLMKKTEDYAINTVRHEIELLLRTDFFLWRLGQREFFRFGYAPTAFLVLYALLESLKTDEKILRIHPQSLYALRQRYEDILQSIKENIYPYHQFALDFVRMWLGKPLESKPEYQKKLFDLRKSFEEYLNSENRIAYDIFMEEFFGKYRILVEKSQELNYMDLLLDEARGRVRQDAHRGRIMTDLLGKLPQEIQNIVKSRVSSHAWDIPEEEVYAVVKSLRSIPEWMRDYIKQMSYIDMMERDLKFLAYFLPKTLETDIEHKGFITFLVKSWEEMWSFTSGKDSGKGSEGMDMYRVYLRSVSPYVESLKRKFQRLLPVEEESFSGGYVCGRRLNTKKLPTEVPIKRGRIFQRREVPERKVMCFKLLMDISSSMKKENKIGNALKSIILMCEVLDSMGMPFSIDVFNEHVMRLKGFDENYNLTKPKLLQLPNRLGGTTDIGKALLFSAEDMEKFSKSNRMKGVLIIFSDGKPTRGLKGSDLKSLIKELKGKFPVVGIGLGQTKNYIEEYFEDSGIRVDSVFKLPFAFSFVVENYLRRLEFSV